MNSVEKLKVRSSVKDKASSLKKSKYLFGRFLYSTFLLIWSLYKFLFNSRYRSEQVSRIIYRHKIIQVSTFTKEDRYPFLFNAIKEELEGLENPKVLSFGCSTGEEVFSLKRLIPNAEFIGVDINQWCVKTAKKRNQYSGCSFRHVKSNEWKNSGNFDCILALAVFQKTIHRRLNTTETTTSFRFNDFEEIVAELQSLLKIGGLIIIDNSDYQLQDLEIYASNFVEQPHSSMKRIRPTFDKNNQKVSETFESGRIYRKILK